MRASRNFLAVDLGASNGRVLVGQWDGSRFELGELHRFANGSVKLNGHLHWDAFRLWKEIKHGLGIYAGAHSAPAAGIGVDAWGVDFALLDAQDRLVGAPYHYRDARTAGILEAVFARVPEAEIFQETGVQAWEINTLSQLYSMVRTTDPQLRTAATLLMIPDLFAYWLGGAKVVEYTVGSTSQMLLKGSREWALGILQRLDIPCEMLPEVCPSGGVMGHLRPEVSDETRLARTTPVIAVAAHDTASAVAAVPGMDAGSVFISSGTWSLMGAEVGAPDTSTGALRSGFTNEAGVYGSVLLLRNLTGLWLLQECLSQWRRREAGCTWDDLLAAAEGAEPLRSLVDPAAQDFMAPEDMPGAIRGFCSRSGQPVPESDGEISRCCIESLSLSYGYVLESLEKLVGRRFDTIRIVGGGSRVRLLCQLTSDVTVRTVVAGPVEASTLGNVAVQAVATGEISDIAQARAAIAASIEQHVYEPRPSEAWEAAYRRFWSLGKRAHSHSNS